MPDQSAQFTRSFGPSEAALAVIPARFGAVRFPGKPLASKTGKPMIQHVYERVKKCASLAKVVVATDDERIASVVQGFGGDVMLTRSDHPSGTDRVAEVASKLDFNLVLNVQGDEPEIDPASIDRLVAVMRDNPEASMGTIACPMSKAPQADFQSPNCVKVVTDKRGRALYFSRAPIPFPRAIPPEPGGSNGTGHASSQPMLHLGVYAYRKEFLLSLTRLEPTPLERTEMLEQLRVLENGYPILVVAVDKASVGIDTPEDYERFVQRAGCAAGGMRQS